MNKWVALIGAGALILYVRSRLKFYIPNEVTNLFWDDEAERWRTNEEVADLLREHPERVPLTLTSGEARILSYLDLIQANAERFNLDPALIAAIISRESGGDYAARGAVGEYGLMQLRPSTAQWLGFSGDPDLLYNPAENIRYGSQYLRYQLDRYAETADPLSFAVSAYNAGTAAVKKGSFTNQEYVDSVVKYRLPRFRLLISRARGIY
jgi:hypothetical protein